MKVLHLIGGGDIGGAKSHVLSLVRELGKHIDVKLISFRAGAFADDARKMGIDVEIVKTFTIISDVRKVLSIVKNGGYDLIHAHGAKANLIAFWVKKFVHLPVVTTVHSDYRLDYLQNILKMFSFGLINTVALRFLDYYIAVSNNFKKMLIKRRFSPLDIFTVYNGINFHQEITPLPKEDFLKKYNLNFAKDDVIIGILARLDPVKGLDTLLKAAHIVVRKNPTVRFLIGGDGPQKKNLEKKAESLGISKNVFFLGFVDKPFDLINCLDINTLTSLSESFPYAILEGSLFKKATVSSNVGGISDLIEDGKSGFLFKPGDHISLADLISTLVDNPSLRGELGENLYKKASTYFSLENMCRTQLGIYKTILERESKKGEYRYDAIISGYYGFKNIGDDAMLMSIIENLNIYKKDIRILVLSKNPLETSLVYNVDSINRFNPFRILSAMKNSKLFVNGGGSLIQDNTSTRSLIYYLSMIWLAKMRGMKVMIYANGIGPLKKERNKKLTRKIVNRVDVITLREDLSYNELKKLKIDRPKIKVTADPALTLKPDTPLRIEQIFMNEGIDLNQQFLGVSVRRWPGREKFETVIAKAVDHLSAKYGITPLFLAMHYPEDLAIIDNITSKMKSKFCVIRQKPTVSEMLGIIQKTQMLVGMRLHALIFAASLRVPIVGMVYEPKVEGFIRYIDQVSAGNIDSLEIEALKEVLENTWRNRDSIKKGMDENIAVLRDKSLENARIAIGLIDES